MGRKNKIYSMTKEARKERRMGINLLRQSKYPSEIFVKGNSIYLNPFKRLIKNKPYKNEEYIYEFQRMLKEFVLKQEALSKIQSQRAEEAIAEEIKKEGE